MIPRLKSLELQGYKTFANRTVFEFPGAVTAIVGPNGSGKSNITDALRWVLGEQSYSLLRGKKTEDMIFAGSERRTRSGMATATVILDNSDDWLPIDYSEVAVTRRAYRDGSNEYLLNGQRVRLRDVSELLAESGLAERTYTIIGQGLVDAALALRAEDRRRLFEEAAGIGLHRSRREEAIRRLDHTHRNLERVTDILAELRPRLKSLERQARRVEDHDQAISNLRSILKEWYGYHWHQAQQALSQAQSSLHDQEKILAEIRKQAAGVDEEMRTLRSERQSLRLEVNEHQQVSTALRSELESVNRELAIAEERLNNLHAQESKIKSDIVRAEEDLDLLEARYKFATQEFKRKNDELNLASEHCKRAKEIRDERLEERAALEIELNLSREKLVEAHTLRSKINTLLTERQAQLEHLEKSSVILSNDLDALKRKLEIKSDEESASAQKLKVLAKQVEQLEIRAEKLTQKSLELKNEYELSTRQLAGKQAELLKLTAEHQVLERAERNYAGYSEGAKALLQAVESEQIQKSLGILSGNIEVSEKFETAIGAALGDYLEAVVLTDRSEIEEALSLLENLTKKAALIPLDVHPPDEIELGLLEKDGLIGAAIEFVSSPSELQPVLELLLKNTYLVEDRTSAKRFLDDYQSSAKYPPQSELRAVTINGEVFHLRGPIKTSAGTKPMSLSQRREEKEIKDKKDKLEFEIHKELEIKENIEGRIESLNKEEQQLKENISHKRDLLDAEKKFYNQYRIELEQLKREFNWQEERNSEITLEKNGVINQINDMNIEAAEVSSSFEEIEDRINSANDRLSQLPIDEFESDLAHWSTRFAVLDQSVLEAGERQEESEVNLEKTKERLHNLISSVEELETDRNDLSERIDSLKREIQQKNEQNNSRMQLIFPAEDKLENIEQKIADLISSETQERQISSQAERSYTQAKITQVRKQEALDSLRKQIEVDFGLVTYEYLDDVSGPNPLPFEDLVEELPIIQELSVETERELNRQRSYLHSIGPVNPESQQEYQQVVERFENLTNQVQDLQDAIADINQVIKELDEIMEQEFCNTFEAVAEEFHQIFSRLFGGGSARLVLTDPDEITDTGIDIEARLPGRREQGLSLLSGGERSLTAVALVFALLRVSPTPFCVLDEVDAMLDEANVGRFRELLRELSETTQFVMITHNRATVQVADIIYGVTMGKDSTSQILSLKVDEIEKVV